MKHFRTYKRLVGGVRSVDGYSSTSTAPIQQSTSSLSSKSQSYHSVSSVDNGVEDGVSSNQPSFDGNSNIRDHDHDHNRNHSHPHLQSSSTITSSSLNASAVIRSSPILSTFPSTSISTRTSCISVAPEGTRSHTGLLQPFKKGL